MKLEPIKTILAVLLVSAVAVSQAAYAETPKSLGTFKDWSAFSSLSIEGYRVCYVMAAPEEKLPKRLKHGDVFFMVTNWYEQKVQKVKGEPSMAVGYEFREGSKVVVEIGSAKWELFTQDKGAWLGNRTDEQALVNAMKRGNSMRVKATSARGNATEYRISLLGVTAALNEINESCDANIS